ncbi:MAG: hypothetical protein CBC24_00405 [Candidatus Pelagibacter sp. TMED64]|jgi:hypothetical protein|nr:hypothetical protein [Candidatus Pelagibacter sp.]OUU67783.1 MAG: hypothetical protein CBC24_00405 [Candidatus Pelagibacter sp. TMED64]
MSYKKQLKKRIKNFYPNIKIGKITLHGVSYKIIIESPVSNMRQLEQELRENLSMPGLCLVSHG